MTLIIEDGTGVPNADSFNTVAECSAHAVAYFGESLTGNEADKEAALRRAFVYMSALDWLPDLWPTFGGTIPEAVKLAQSVFARAEFRNVNFLSPSVALQGRKVLNKVGEIGWDVTHGPNTVEAARPIVTMGMDFLAPYLKRNPAKSGGTFDLVRS
jgi:hypothetical protein